MVVCIFLCSDITHLWVDNPASVKIKQKQFLIIMSNTTTARLIEAAKWISKYEDSELSMIQFEDGSGNNFNYTVAKTGRTKFITWDELCIGLGYNPDNLCVTAKKPTISEAELDDLIREAFKRIEENKK